jgi:hypothetical protein
MVAMVFPDRGSSTGWMAAMVFIISIFLTFLFFENTGSTRFWGDGNQQCSGVSYRGYDVDC